MKRPIVLKKTCFVTLSIMVVLALFVPIQSQSAQAADYTLKAPEIALPPVTIEPGNGEGEIGSLFNFSLTLDGWTCGDHIPRFSNQPENFADIAISKIRQINILLQPFARAQTSLAALEKELTQAAGRGNPFTKEQAEFAVNKVVSESGLYQTSGRIEEAESLSKKTIEQIMIKNERTSFSYGYLTDPNEYMFKKNYSEFRPGLGGVWNLAKIEQNTTCLLADCLPTVTYVARNCYQKKDVEMMLNAVVSAAQKLQEAVTKFKEAKEKALAQGVAAPIKK